EVLRKRRGELNNAVVEQWRPDFEGMRHAHAIHFIQNIVRQVEMVIYLKIAVQIANLLRRGHNVEQPPYVGTAQTWAEASDLRCRAGAVPKEMRLIRRQERALQHALEFVFEANLLIGDRPEAMQQR